MEKLDKFSVQVKYTGSFEDYTNDDWKNKALARVNQGVDAYDRTIEVENGKEWDYKFTADNTYPCNKIATVTWYEIQEAEYDS
jgi:hypothetical protein